MPTKKACNPARVGPIVCQAPDFRYKVPHVAIGNSSCSPTLYTIGFLSCPSRCFEPPNAMSQRQPNVHHLAPSSSCSMTSALRVAPHGVADHNAMVNWPCLNMPSRPPPYTAYHENPHPENKLPSGYSKDTVNHPSNVHTRLSLAVQSTGKHHTPTPKGGVHQSLVHTGKDQLVSKIFRKRKKEDVGDHLEWPPRGTKLFGDPNLPGCGQLVSPFDSKFEKLKANAKTQEEWDELQRIRRASPSSSPQKPIK